MCVAGKGLREWVGVGCLVRLTGVPPRNFRRKCFRGKSLPTFALFTFAPPHNEHRLHEQSCNGLAQTFNFSPNFYAPVQESVSVTHGDLSNETTHKALKNTGQGLRQPERYLPRGRRAGKHLTVGHMHVHPPLLMRQEMCCRPTAVQKKHPQKVRQGRAAPCLPVRDSISQTSHETRPFPSTLWYICHHRTGATLPQLPRANARPRPVSAAGMPLLLHPARSSPQNKPRAKEPQFHRHSRRSDCTFTLRYSPSSNTWQQSTRRSRLRM